MSNDASPARQVVMYSSRFCPYCMMASSLLQRKGVGFEVLCVDGDPGLRQEMMARSGRSSVPQIFIGEHHVGGCDDLHALDGQGKLDEMLGLAAG